MSVRVCTVARAYPRGELPFLEEWLDFHLRLGVDHVFLGLHVNEDLHDPTSYVPSKRPFAAMYDLESTEAEIVEATLSRVGSFRPRLSAYIVHRPPRADLDALLAAQRRFYNTVFGLQRGEFDWIAAHDIDEYLVPQEPYRSIRAALDACPDSCAALYMEQVVVEARWDEDGRPRRPPLLTPELRRCSEIVPRNRGIKTFVRTQAASALGIHIPELVAGARAQEDRRILTYHLRGFPSHHHASPPERLPVRDEVLDVTDDRPWSLRHDAPPIAEPG